MRPRSKPASLPGHLCLATGCAAGIDWPLAVSGSHVHRCDESPTNLDRAATDRLKGIERTAARNHFIQAGPTYVSFAQRSGHFQPILRLTPA
ncbi:hypothetical protein BJ965_007086 [Streptomyces luteogriseus]|uniref:Uncharacterized protein n=1 Tax=Streptomyces luteogriseus TaxID=68233 RepID=A0A7W7DUJ7_9ACTN|nr:hypothetical protein [Streptomyces luteogriseus]